MAKCREIIIRRKSIGVFVVLMCLQCGIVALALPAKSVDQGERATALVDVTTTEGREFGSAFCIDTKGIFVTDAHVVALSTGKIKIVVRPGEKDQRELDAHVMGIDYEADLAVMKTDNPGVLAALVLGDSDAILPTQEVTAFGYPFGRMLALDKDSYPSISVNSGKVTAVRKEKGEMRLIQIDALVNPGNSGGPVLDAQGRVIGIVESGVPGAGLNFATPVSKLKKMMQGPMVVIDPISIDYAQRNKPQKFSIRVSSSSGGDTSYDVSLQLTGPKGESQTVSGKTAGGACDLTLTPTTDTAAIKWDPFSEAAPRFKFSLTLTDSQKKVFTQQGTIFLTNIPLAIETAASAGKKSGTDPLPEGAVETEILGSTKTNAFREINTKHMPTGVHYVFGENRAAAPGPFRSAQ